MDIIVAATLLALGIMIYKGKTFSVNITVNHTYKHKTPAPQEAPTQLKDDEQPDVLAAVTSALQDIMGVNESDANRSTKA